MPDILIRGADKPFNCFTCDLSYLGGERLFCCITEHEVIRSAIAPDCPIVELPPHGDLISAGAVFAILDELIKRCENDDMTFALNWARESIGRLPVVIPESSAQLHEEGRE